MHAAIQGFIVDIRMISWMLDMDLLRNIRYLATLSSHISVTRLGTKTEKVAHTCYIHIREMGGSSWLQSSGLWGSLIPWTNILMTKLHQNVHKCGV